jgi:hypothetical protein
VDIRFYLDPDTGLPHIYGHGVTEADVERVLRRPGEDGPSSGGSRQAVGQAEGGRYFPRDLHPRRDWRFGFRGHGLSAGRARTQGVSQAEAEEEAGEMSEQRFPAGWDERRVRELLAELDARTEEEWVAADEAAATESEDQAVVTVPAALLPEIRRLLAAHKTA